MGRTNNYHTNQWWKQEKPSWKKKKEWEREMSSANNRKSQDEMVSEWTATLHSFAQTPDEFFEQMDREYEEKKARKGTQQ